MLEIKSLVKTYGKFKAVDNLNFTIDNSTIFGFVGPNGAGKTTTIKIISGLLKADSGNILFDDIELTKDYRVLKDKIGYMPDFFGVYNNLKVNEYMDFYAGAYYIPVSERREIINNLLEVVDLTDKTDSYVDNLSRGMKQRLCLARCMIHDPDILILDEPASGLDPRARFEMKEILKQLKSLGKTIIISSHILSEMTELCTDIGIINKGKMVQYGSVDEILNNLNTGRKVIIKYISEKEKLVKLLEEKPFITSISENSEDVTFSLNGDKNILSNLLTEIINSGISVYSFAEKEGSLEDVFMNLTEEEGENVG